MSALTPRIDALDLPNVRSSEGSGTTTLVFGTDKMWQIFTLTASRTCVLPSASVLKGQRVRLDNTGNFPLVVQASGGLSLTIANSANIDASIHIGKVELIALQDTPTTPAHWRVTDISETGTVTYSGSNSGTGTIQFQRTWQTVSLAFVVNHSSAGGTTSSAGLLATRLCPVGFRNNIWIMTGNPQWIDRCEIAADGSITMTHQLVQTSPGSPSTTNFTGFITYSTAV